MSKITTLIDSMQDLRNKQGLRHPLDIIIVIKLFTLIQGLTSVRDIDNSIKNNQKKLLEYFKCDRLPSGFTVYRVCKYAIGENFLTLFNEWGMQHLRTLLPTDSQVAIDGKAFGGTTQNPHDKGQFYYSTLSAYCCHLVIYMNTFNTAKSCELHETQRFLAGYNDLNISLDALHTTKKTNLICHENGHSFFIGLKWNQPKLIKEALKATEVVDKFTLKKANRTEIYEVLTPKEALKDWKDIRHFVRVTTIDHKNKNQHHIRYYITNQYMTGGLAKYRCRKHWSIENGLHWTKDVLYGEDTIKYTNIISVTNSAILMAIALNAIRFNTKKTIAKANLQLMNNPELAMKWLNAI